MLEAPDTDDLQDAESSMGLCSGHPAKVSEQAVVLGLNVLEVLIL